MGHAGYSVKVLMIVLGVVILQIGIYALFIENFTKAPQSQCETCERGVAVSGTNETRSVNRTLSIFPHDTNETRPVTRMLPICPLVSSYLELLPLGEIAKLNPSMMIGRYKPVECISRNRVAIIIPYRDREDHLKVLLHNLVPVLVRQQLDFGIYLVEQVNGTGFNRGSLMNIGFTVASRTYDYQCFVFHDVDLVPENDRTLYSCPEQPRHLSVLLNKWDYKLKFPGYFGGVTVLSRENFTKINGYSNKYFGWGAEDDDLRSRVLKAGLKTTRYDDTLARYQMISHKQADKNPDMMKLKVSGHTRFKIDGLNSLKYSVLETDYQPLFTRILVNFNKTEVMMN